MNTQQIIELYRPAIIQIATQTSTGTGFYVKEFDLIITNEHVVSKNAEITSPAAASSGAWRAYGTPTASTILPFCSRPPMYRYRK